MLNTKITTALMTATALLAAPAFAGNVQQPVQDAVIATPYVAPAPVGPNWTGFYAGGQLGWGDVDTQAAGVDGDGLIGGVIGGYNYDYGNNWVVGLGLDYDFADIDLGGAASLEEVFRIKSRLGYKIGNGLLYGTGGYAWADTDTLGDDNGYFVGAGYEHMITQSLSLGVEALYHQFDNFGTAGVDVDATTVQARAALHF